MTTVSDGAARKRSALPRVNERTNKRTGKTVYYVRLRDPQRKTQTSETFDNRKAAQDFVTLIGVLGPAGAIAHRDAADAGVGRRLADLWEPYIAWRTTRVRSDRTIADYRRDWTNWVEPAFGARRIDDVTPGQVQEWVDGMSAKLSPKSVADRHGILSGLYLWAVRTNRTDSNPCATTDLPKRRKKPVKALRPAEWEALHAALQQIDPDAADLALFMVLTGWRFSEATALSGFHVEDYPEGCYVTMERVVRRNAAGQHVVVEDAKSEAGNRRINLSPKVAAVVRRRLIGRPPSALVFTTRTDAQWHYSNFVNRIWRPAVKAANLTRQPTPHWLRHSHVVWLALTHKVSLPELQRRLGHEHIETTMGTYGRMIEDVSTDALAALDAMIGGPPTLEG